MDDGLTQLAYLAFVLLGFIGATISAVFGFGTGPVLLSLGTFLIGVKEAIALAAVIFIASTATKSWVYRHQIDWRLTIFMTLFSLPFATIGALLLVYVRDDLIEKALGLMLLTYLILSATKKMPKLTFGRAGIATGSALYGLSSGLLGTGNLVKAVMFREMGLERQAYVGTMAATSVLASFVKVGVYAQSGLLEVRHLPVMAGLVLAAVLAVLIGRQLLNRVSAKQFQIGLQILLALSAAALLF